MNGSEYKRDAEHIHGLIHETSSGILIAVKPLVIYVPRGYEGTRLLTIAKEVRTVAVFCIVDPEAKKYGVSKAVTLMPITPTTVTIVSFDDGEYYEFSFAAGSTICPNYNLVKDDTLSYTVYDMIIAKGHIPWYLDYIDLATLLDTSNYHAGLNLGPSNVPMEMIAASISRDPKNMKAYYRHGMKAGVAIREQPVKPSFIAFRNIIYGATNTTAKLTGSYFDDGMASALVNTSEKTESVETLLRK